MLVGGVSDGQRATGLSMSARISSAAEGKVWEVWVDGDSSTPYGQLPIGRQPKGSVLDATPTALATPTTVPSVQRPGVSSKSPMESLSNPIRQEDDAPSADLHQTICSYPWPQGCDYWLEVVQCESTLGEDPNAYTDWNPYVGLFQIWIGHGYDREWLKDDTNNTQAAWEVSHEGRYTGAWPYCQWQ